MLNCSPYGIILTFENKNSRGLSQGGKGTHIHSFWQAPTDKGEKEIVRGRRGNRGKESHGIDISSSLAHSLTPSSSFSPPYSLSLGLSYFLVRCTALCFFVHLSLLIITWWLLLLSFLFVVVVFLFIILSHPPPHRPGPPGKNRVPRIPASENKRTTD